MDLDSKAFLKVFESCPQPYTAPSEYTCMFILLYCTGTVRWDPIDLSLLGFFCHTSTLVQRSYTWYSCERTVCRFSLVGVYINAAASAVTLFSWNLPFKCSSDELLLLLKHFHLSVQTSVNWNAAVCGPLVFPVCLLEMSNLKILLEELWYA